MVLKRGGSTCSQPVKLRYQALLRPSMEPYCFSSHFLNLALVPGQKQNWALGIKSREAQLMMWGSLQRSQPKNAGEAEATLAVAV